MKPVKLDDWEVVQDNSLVKRLNFSQPIPEGTIRMDFKKDKKDAVPIISLTESDGITVDRTAKTIEIFIAKQKTSLTSTTANYVDLFGDIKIDIDEDEAWTPFQVKLRIYQGVTI